MTNSNERAGQARQDALETSRRLSREGSSIMHETAPPPEDWVEFCSSFSAAHSGWIVTLRRVTTEVLDEDPERARKEGIVLARGATLSSVRLADDDGTPRFEIQVGEGPEGATHAVEQPRRVMLKRTHEGADAGLRVDGDDGRTTLLLFRVPARPAHLDGVAPAER